MIQFIAKFRRFETMRSILLRFRQFVNYFNLLQINLIDLASGWIMAFHVHKWPK